MALQIADRVKETTTTTGTGPLTLAGAMTAFRAFSSVCAVGDTVFYALQAVDGSGNATGAWECGLGTYSAASTLTRTTILSSSNAGAAVSLAAGTTQVWLDIVAASLAVQSLTDVSVTESATIRGFSLTYSQALGKWTATQPSVGPYNPPIAATAWDPTKASPVIVLAANNTHVSTSNSSRFSNVGGLVDMSRQKTYFEISPVVARSSSQSVFGIADKTWDFTQNNQAGMATGNPGVVLGGDGKIYNSSTTGTLVFTSSTILANSVIGVAYDPATRKVWFRVDNSGWNNDVIGNQDPANGIGGIVASGTYSPIPALGQASTAVNTLNSGNGTAFAKTPPVGFVGFQPAGVGAADVSVTESSAIHGYQLTYDQPSGKWLAVRGALASVNPAVTTTAWDPAKKTASMTLSVNNTKATPAGGTFDNVGGTVDLSQQKSYFEISVAVAISNSNNAIGICDAAGSFANGQQPGQGDGPGVVLGGDGKIYNGTTAGTLVFTSSTILANSVIGVAYDPATRKTWFRVDASGWNNDVVGNQDPANGIGGIVASGTYSPVALVCASSSSLVTTLNHGNGTAFAKTPPVGFVGFNPATMGLADVAISAPADGQILQYSAAAGKWVNAGGGRPYFRATATSGTIAATATKLVMGTEVFDSDGCYDNTTNYRFTPNRAGKYRVSVKLFAGVVTGLQYVQVYVYKNGAAYDSSQVSQTTVSQYNLCTSSTCTVDMNGSTDYLEMWGLGTVSTTMLGGSPASCMFEAEYIGP